MMSIDGADAFEMERAELGDAQADFGGPALTAPDAAEFQDEGGRGEDAKKLQDSLQVMDHTEPLELGAEQKEAGLEETTLRRKRVGEPFGNRPADMLGFFAASGPEPRGWVLGQELKMPKSQWGSPTWYLQQSQWLAALFPNLPPAPGKTKTPRSTWPAEARALARSLLRSEKLAKLQGGIEIEQQEESFDVRWAELSSRSRQQALLSAGAWLTRAEGDGQPTLLNWCDGKERGVLSRPFQLGRVRAAAPGDVQSVPLDLRDHSLSPLDQNYPSHIPVLERQTDGRTLLVLKHPSNAADQTRVLIDTTRHVILSIEQRQNGKRTGLTRFEDFVEVAGCWWARRIETTDEQGHVTSRLTRTIKPLDAEALSKQMKSERIGKDAVQFLHQPAKTIAEAKRALAAGKASFDDHFTLLRYFAGRQQWTRAGQHLRKCEELASGKPGLRWLRYAFLQVQRRHEELRKRLLDEAEGLAKAKPSDPAGSDDLVLAEHVVSQAGQVCEANEMLRPARSTPADLRPPAGPSASNEALDAGAAERLASGRTDGRSAARAEATGRRVAARLFLAATIRAGIGERRRPCRRPRLVEGRPQRQGSLVAS